MLRTISIAFISSLVAAQASFAGCPSPTYKVGNVTLNSDGVVSRTVYQQKRGDSQNGNTDTVYVPVVRDRITLTEGDSIVLNADPSMQDAMLQVEVSLKSQQRDTGGVIASIYNVKENMISMFSGTPQVAEVKNAFVTVKSNYQGKDVRTKECAASVTKIDLDFQVPVRGF